MDAVIHSSHAVSFPAALIAAAGNGNPRNSQKHPKRGKTGKAERSQFPFLEPKDSDAHRDLSERYASAMRRDYIGVIERLACAVSHGTIYPACDRPIGRIFAATQRRRTRCGSCRWRVQTLGCVVNPLEVCERRQGEFRNLPGEDPQTIRRRRANAVPRA